MAHRTTLKELIEAGRLAQGEELLCEPRRGEVYKARLSGDGSIAYDGKSFKTPSSWATHVAGNNRDGWKEVSARGKVLDDFRSQITVASGTGAEREPALPPKLPVVSAQPEPSPPKPVVEEAKASTMQDLLARLQSLTPSQFEHLVAAYLTHKGVANIKVTGKTGDGGIDGEGEVPFLKLKLAFQAKRYGADSSVGANPIRNFKGGVVGKYDRGVFITTSSFTPGAIEEINNPGVVIIPIDGNQLVKEMIEMQLGVKHVAVSVAIDEDFFKGLGG